MIDDPPTVDAQNAVVLDGLAASCEELEAIVIFLIDAVHVIASWIHPSKPISLGVFTPTLHAAFTASLAAGDLLTPENAPRDQRPGFVRPEATCTMTLELADHTLVVQRLRGFGVATLFASRLPLGLARAQAKEVLRNLAHELPYANSPTSIQVLSGRRSSMNIPAVRPIEHMRTREIFDEEEPAPDTGRQSIPVSRDAAVDPPPSSGRARRILEELADHAPDANVVLLRVGLRTGLGLEPFMDPETLSGEALVLLETAAEDILGLDRGMLKERVP